jgi:hypothetical protein
MIFLYRKSSGEVLGASTDEAIYRQIDRQYYDTVADPMTLHGTDLRPVKIWDGLVLRQATVDEQRRFREAAAIDFARHKLTTKPCCGKKGQAA